MSDCERDVLVAEARQRLAVAVANGVPFPEVVFALRDGACLLVAGGVAQPDRRLLGASLVVAAADSLLHVSHVSAAVDGGFATDALGVVEVAPGQAAPLVEVHPLRRHGNQVRFSGLVTFGADSAAFGPLVDDLRAAWSQVDEALRLAALVRLESDGLLLQVAPALDAELSALMEGRRPT